MGALRKAFDALGYAIAIMALLFVAGMLFGIESQFGSLFSAAGFVVLFFLIFTLLVGKSE